MYQVGITGGIGSGKSTVAAIFEVLGIPVLRADDVAKMLMNKDPGLKAAITAAFGDGIYHEGVLDRKYLANLVFGNKEKLRLLNSLVHPATIQYTNEWAQLQTAPYVIKEAALIFESGSFKELKKIIGISAPEALRIMRVQQRDQNSEADIRKRMNEQMDEQEKMKRCDYVIFNDGSQPLIPQVLQVHEMLLRQAGQ